MLIKGRDYNEYFLAVSTEEADVHREVLRTSEVAMDLGTDEFLDRRS